jgi:hypothetical protein
MHSPRNPDNVLPHRRCGATPKPTKRIERPVREAKKIPRRPIHCRGNCVITREASRAASRSPSFASSSILSAAKVASNL